MFPRSFSKFKNKRVKLDGYTFDSIAEAKHYQHTLLPRFKAGEITHLEVHPRIKCIVDGDLICTYIADFSFIDRSEISPQGGVGCLVYEDVKGFKTDVYKLKKKLVEACYKGTKIIEISPKPYSKIKLIEEKSND
mgnify:FL=1|tara:strand:+ start:298 stop:702 length:405 start_codon:yes stop_codon:yes gene_type:complete